MAGQEARPAARQPVSMQVNILMLQFVVLLHEPSQAPSHQSLLRKPQSTALSQLQARARGTRGGGKEQEQEEGAKEFKARICKQFHANKRMLQCLAWVIL